jgi:hypothetical protein
MTNGGELAKADTIPIAYQGPPVTCLIGGMAG